MFQCSSCADRFEHCMTLRQPVFSEFPGMVLHSWADMAAEANCCSSRHVCIRSSEHALCDRMKRAGFSGGSNL